MKHYPNLILKDCSVLIADDDENVTKSISSFLKPICKNVIIANSGTEVLEIFYSHRVDMMFIDIEMPSLNGLEAIKEIRKKDRNIAIFVVTGHSKKEYLLEAVNLRLDGFIVKPITTKKLLECVKTNQPKNASVQYIISKESDLKYNYKTKNLTLKNSSIKLTNSEVILLELFLKNRGLLVPYDEIDNEVYKDRGMGRDSLRSLIKRLRKKIEGGASIEATPGIGYTLKCLD
jgi:DNA-binding response OmpR family regulator